MDQSLAEIDHYQCRRALSFYYHYKQLALLPTVDSTNVFIHYIRILNSPILYSSSIDLIVNLTTKITETMDLPTIHFVPFTLIHW